MNIFQLFPKKIENDVQFDMVSLRRQEGEANAENIGVDKIYVVKPLDTLETIASKLQIPIEELKIKINNNHLFIGQKIKF